VTVTYICTNESSRDPTVLIDQHFTLPPNAKLNLPVEAAFSSLACVFSAGAGEGLTTDWKKAGSGPGRSVGVNKVVMKVLFLKCRECCIALITLIRGLTARVG
jgi:hypothetical protein